MKANTFSSRPHTTIEMTVRIRWSAAWENEATSIWLTFVYIRYMYVKRNKRRYRVRVITNTTIILRVSRRASLINAHRIPLDSGWLGQECTQRC